MKFTKQLILLLLVTVISCQKSVEKCTLKIDSSNAENTSIKILPYKIATSKEEYYGMLVEKTISNEISSIEFDDVEMVRFGTIRFNKKPYSFSFISEKSMVTLDMDSVNNICTVKGGDLNTEFNKIKKELNYEQIKLIKRKPDSLTAPEEKELIKTSKKTLWSLLDENPTSKALPYFFYKKYDTAGLDTLNIIISKFSPTVHTNFYVSELIRKRDQAMKVEIGAKVSEFTLNTDKDQPFNLSSYKGKYILLDFWASWCIPCRKEIPNMKKLYAEYQSKGLEFISISVDKSKEDWLEAVEKEQMPWLQLIDAGSLSKDYNINYIPMLFLLDENYTIVAKGMHGYDEVNDILNKHINKTVE